MSAKKALLACGATTLQGLRRFCQRIDKIEVEQANKLLFWLFWLAVATFSLGQVFVVAGPLLCLPPLFFLYRKDWKNRSLARLPVRWLFVIFFLSLAMQLFLSRWMDRSWEFLAPNLLRALVLPFIAMECVRTERDLKRLVAAFFCGALAQGVNGVWQYVTGLDLIKKAPLMTGRLTGSFGTYRVGDYMGIVLLPACAVWLLLPLRKAWGKSAATLLLLSPAFFLWIFAQARMGYIAFALGLYAVWLTSQKVFSLKSTLLPLLALALLIALGPSRLSVEQALADPRGELWITAWQTFQQSPWFGTGIGTYIPALQAAGLDLPINKLTVQHPHNAYLQFLVDGGLVGFSAFVLFLFGMALWSWRRVRRGVCAEMAQEAAGGNPGVFWRLSLFFWAGWLSYLIVAAGGHDFYRTWFLSTGMTMLGVLLGACVNAPSFASGTVPRPQSGPHLNPNPGPAKESA